MNPNKMTPSEEGTRTGRINKIRGYTSNQHPEEIEKVWKNSLTKRINENPESVKKEFVEAYLSALKGKLK